MPEPIEKQIVSRIRKAGRGVLFFPNAFSSYGDAASIRKALERLVKKGELNRVATGIYVRPKIDNVIGKVTPGIEEIAEAIARKGRARIIPSGVYALNRLGLSTQMPLNIVYLTDGAARKIKIGNRTITFKKTTPKNVASAGEISGLAIQALKTIGKEKVTEDDIMRIQKLLLQEEKTKLLHDIRLAPEWIKKIIYPVLKEANNE
jgi:hypothetical protein